MSLQIISVLISCLLLLSCGESKPINSGVAKVQEIPSSFDTLGISKDVFREMLKEGDHIDIIFNNLALSMNQDGNTALYKDLQYISSRPLKSLVTDCEPLARKIYLSKGEIIMEGDLYHEPGCHFQVFIKDGKKLYGNHLTPQGVAFVDQLLKHAEAAKPNQ